MYVLTSGTLRLCGGLVVIGHALPGSRTRRSRAVTSRSGRAEGEGHSRWRGGERAQSGPPELRSPTPPGGVGLRRLVTLLLTIAFLVTACGSPAPSSTAPGASATSVPSPSPSPSPTPLPSLSATIPAEGTTLAIPGGASVGIPAGAVPPGTTGSISAALPSGGPTDAWPADPIGPTWTIEAGAGALAKPVTLTLPFDEGALPLGADPAGLLLAYRDPATGSWVPVPSTVDPTAQTVTATVDHLSDWGLFTIDWDYWVAFIKQAASGNLGDFLNGVVTITGKCATKSPVFTVDNGSANGMVKGCITSSTKTSAKLRITNLRAFRLKLFGSALDGANGSLLASGESVSFSVGGNQAQPVVVAADLDALGLGYDITDIVLRLLPGSELTKDAGTYAKVLDEILTAQAELWTTANILDDLKAGKLTAAASATVELLTSETYLTTLLEALHAAGKAHGIPILASLSKEGIKRVLTVVNLTDLIVTTFTFITQYFITAHSEVKVSWVMPPAAPTNVRVATADILCPEQDPQSPWEDYCFRVTVTWRDRSNNESGFRIYRSAWGTDYIGPPPPTLEEQCGPRKRIATVKTGVTQFTYLIPATEGLCHWVAAFNSFGESKKVIFAPR